MIAPIRWVGHVLVQQGVPHGHRAQPTPFRLIGPSHCDGRYSRHPAIRRCVVALAEAVFLCRFPSALSLPTVAALQTTDPRFNEGKPRAASAWSHITLIRAAPKRKGSSCSDGRQPLPRIAAGGG